MAGRGRGGRGLSFNIDALGFGRGDALPQAINQPPPLFPPLELKAVPLLQGEEYEYMLALKQEFRGTIHESPFYIKITEKKKDIHRYSDKYQSSLDNNISWEPVWDRLPNELKWNRKKLKKVRFNPRPNLPSKAEAAEVIKTLESLEKKDIPNEENDEEEKEAEEEEEEEIFEEDDEEDNDYNLNYFDNGENYGDDDDDDDMDEGPIC